MVEMVIRVAIKILTSLGVNANLDKVTKIPGPSLGHRLTDNKKEKTNTSQKRPCLISRK